MTIDARHDPNGLLSLKNLLPYVLNSSNFSSTKFQDPTLYVIINQDGFGIGRVNDRRRGNGMFPSFTNLQTIGN